MALVQDVDAILNHIKPTHPMDSNDSIAIFELVKPCLVTGQKLDVMHDKIAIHVRVYDDRGLIIYERALVAV